MSRSIFARGKSLALSDLLCKPDIDAVRAELVRRLKRDRFGYLRPREERAEIRAAIRYLVSIERAGVTIRLVDA